MVYDVKDFNEEVIKRSKKIPVLVDFWAEWCGPCKMLGPVLEKMADKYEGKFELAKLNTDGNQAIAVQYGIRSIPNVKLFINGEVTDEFTGALPEQKVEKWLMKAIPDKNAEEVNKANDLLKKGETERASLILEKLLKSEPDNAKLKILLAKAILFKDYITAEKLASECLNDIENSEIIDSIKTIAHLFSITGLNGSGAASEYKSAIEELRNKNFDLALEKFIDVIKTDRILDEDGARKACIAIFKYLGEENEITLKHRRNFGSALYI